MIGCLDAIPVSKSAAQRHSAAGGSARALLRIAVVAACLAPAWGHASSIIFRDDFENYAVGTELPGQGGWIEARNEDGTTNGPVRIGAGRFLPSKVLDGITTFGVTPRQATLVRPIGRIDPRAVTTLSFDGYAASLVGVLTSHNFLVGLGSSQSATSRIDHYWAANANFGDLRWQFVSRLDDRGALARESYGGGFDRAASFQIVLDGPRNQIFGRYDFGSGPVETGRYTVAPGWIANVDQVGVYMDYRDRGRRTGGEFDNIVVTSDAPRGVRLADLRLRIDGVETNGASAPEADLRGFDRITGLGEIVVRLGGAGRHRIGLLADHDIDADFNSLSNERGEAHGTSLLGQRWEIDEPGFGGGGYFGDILANFQADALDQLILENRADATVQRLLEDIALAMGWEFELRDGEQARLRFMLSLTQPSDGFYLVQRDPDSGLAIYLSAALERIAAEPPADRVPAPASAWLLLCGLAAAIAASRKRGQAGSLAPEDTENHSPRGIVSRQLTRRH